MVCIAVIYPQCVYSAAPYVHVHVGNNGVSADVEGEGGAGLYGVQQNTRIQTSR